MAKKWNTEKRFETGSDWVRASLKFNGVSASILGSEETFTRYCDLVGATCKRSKGVWTRLKRPPKDDRALVWYAFNIAKHYVEWGNLAPWGERVTVALMNASESARDDFELVLNSTTLIGKSRKEG